MNSFSRRVKSLPSPPPQPLSVHRSSSGTEQRAEMPILGLEHHQQSQEQGAPPSSALFSRPHSAVLSRFILKHHGWGKVHLNCVLKPKNKRFLPVLVRALKRELPPSTCSVRLEAAGRVIGCQNTSSLFGDTMYTCSAPYPRRLRRTVRRDQSWRTSGLEQEAGGLPGEASLASGPLVPPWLTNPRSVPAPLCSCCVFVA